MSVDAVTPGFGGRVYYPADLFCQLERFPAGLNRAFPTH